MTDDDTKVLWAQRRSAFEDTAHAERWKETAAFGGHMGSTKYALKNPSGASLLGCSRDLY